MNRTTRGVLIRILLVVPQTLALVTLVFVLVRLLPGDPVLARLGGHAPESAVLHLRHQLGLDLPLHMQYVNYVNGLLHGDLGESWRTSQPVLEDLKSRAPATLELLFLGMGLSTIIGIVFGAIGALRPGGVVDKAAMPYELLAGALPEFYIGIILIFLFYTTLGIAPHPAGRLDISTAIPAGMTGFYLLDSLMTGNWPIFKEALGHLALPTITVVFWECGAVMKMTRSSMQQVMDSEFISYARLMGLRSRVVARYVLRNALPPVMSLTITLFAVLIGAMVLIEEVFSWGGLGQYSIQSVVSADYEAIAGFLIAASLVSLLLFIALDIVFCLIDPRLEL